MAVEKEEGVNPMPEKKAVILLSGGLDSTTLLAIAAKDGYELYAVTFLYGQRHSVEIESAKKAAAMFKVKKHSIIELPIDKIVLSSLTGSGEIPMDRTEADIKSGVPSTYVPARNTVFLSLALAIAENIDAEAIFIGVNALDYSGYPDCRPSFIDAFQRLADVATRRTACGDGKIEIKAPLIDMKKSEIIRKGIELGVDYSVTHSCYSPDEEGRSCGRCDSCVLRKKAFTELGMVDPVTYVK